jgi:hypothetical protein
MIDSLKLIVLHPRLQKEIGFLINFGPSGVDVKRKYRTVKSTS